MRLHNLLIAAVILSFSAACARIDEHSVPQFASEQEQIMLRAYQEGANGTKTIILEGGTQLAWEVADEVKVFFRGCGSRFVSQNTEPALVADFTGSLNIISGAHEGVNSGNPLWALYPYRDDARSDGSSVTTVLEPEQIGRAGSFDRNTHISLSRTNSLDVAFYNVTGGVRFSLAQEGIRSVSFEGNNGEALAGTIELGFKDGVPCVNQVTDAETRLTLKAPDGGTFETGKWFFIEAVPDTLLHGFKMIFMKDDSYAELVSSRPVIIKRGGYGSVSLADKNLEFKPLTVPEAVDLGLSVKWASCNVGATSPEKYGDYFAWGETEAKSEYRWENYKWCNGSDEALTKYNINPKRGSVDNKILLEEEDDAARVVIGDKWRTPVRKEWEELITQCNLSLVTRNGVQGYEFKSRINNESIFLPAAGHRVWGGGWMVGEVCDYWSAELYGESNSAVALRIEKMVAQIRDDTRYNGFSVRPVFDEGKAEVRVTAVSLDHNYITISAGQSKQLIATVSPTDADNKSVVWESSNPSIASVSASGLVTAHSIGEAIITVTSVDGAYTDSCRVVVIGNTAVPVTGIVLSDSAWTLDYNGSFTLMATVLPSSATDRTVYWTSSNNDVATVDNGFVQAVFPGETTITARAGDCYAYCNVTVIDSRAVDMGLSVLWATHNIGAASFDDYGSIYAWGEHSPKLDYWWPTYIWCEEPYEGCPLITTTLTKYCDNADYGNVDGLLTLLKEDDVANIAYGGNWRTPTRVEWQELMNNCTWTWSAQYNQYGFVVTSNINGNKIFLPAAGFRVDTSYSNYGTNGYYWSASVYSGAPYDAYALFMSSGEVKTGHTRRYFGFSIRAVASPW